MQKRKQIKAIRIMNRFKECVNALQRVWDEGLLNDLTEENVRNSVYELTEFVVPKVDNLSEKELKEYEDMFVDAIPYIEM